MNYFHPQRMPVLPARRRAAARRQLEELVSGSARSAGSGQAGGQRARRRIRPPAVVAAVVAVVVLGTGAAAAVEALIPVTNHSSVRCFTAARSSGAYYTTLVEPSRGLTRAAIHHAKVACAGLFRKGILKYGTQVGLPPRPLVPHRAPRFVVCVLGDGTAAVVPGRSPSRTCGKLGLRAAARQ
jgi:hypothetical protein